MDWFLQAVAAFFGCIGFAFLFQTPVQYLFSCGLSGAVCWATYLFSLALMDGDVIGATLVSAAITTLLSRILAIVHKTPNITFLVCGLFTIVPGAGIYDTAYHFIMEEGALSLASGTMTLKCAIAIAVGTVLVSSLPNKWFKALSILGSKA